MSMLRGSSEYDMRAIATWADHDVLGQTSYLDATVTPGGSYVYQVLVQSEDVVYGSPVVQAHHEGLAVSRLKLLPNVPNPFNPRTSIRFELAEPAAVRLQIFDGAGRRIRSVRLPTKNRGQHAWIWNGLDSAGQPVASGIYHVQVEAGRDRDKRSMTLVR